jgi:hypothetical protein
MGEAKRRKQAASGKEPLATTQIMAHVNFSSWDIINHCARPDPDLAGAAAELEKAGYTVHRLPETYRQRLKPACNAHIMEAVIADRDDIEAVMAEVDKIAQRYGGECGECGLIKPGHVPFAWLREKLQDPGWMRCCDLRKAGFLRRCVREEAGPDGGPVYVKGRTSNNGLDYLCEITPEGRNWEKTQRTN